MSYQADMVGQLISWEGFVRVYEQTDNDENNSIPQSFNC